MESSKANIEVAPANRTKLQEEIERLQRQLSAERSAHARVRDDLREARIDVRSERLSAADTERRLLREAASVREELGDALLLSDRATLVAGVLAFLLTEAIVLALGAVVSTATGTSYWMEVMGVAAAVGALMGALSASTVQEWIRGEEEAETQECGG
jgi:hypothetical protein